MLQKFRPKPPTYPPKPWQRQHMKRRPASLPVGSYGGGRPPNGAARERIYRAIVEYAKQHGGHSPTRRELCILADVSSTSVASYHIDALIDDGMLEIIDRKLLIVGSKWFPPSTAE